MPYVKIIYTLDLNLKMTVIFMNFFMQQWSIKDYWFDWLTVFFLIDSTSAKSHELLYASVSRNFPQVWNAHKSLYWVDSSFLHHSPSTFPNHMWCFADFVSGEAKFSFSIISVLVVSSNPAQISECHKCRSLNDTY